MAGLAADPWQADFLRHPPARALLCCSRSAGKSLAAAALGLLDTILVPDSLVLILSPSKRQSAEVSLKVHALYEAAGRPRGVLKETESELRLSNGSRIIALPSTEKTVRTYGGVRRLIIDEAARVSDELYRAVRPMVAVSQGSILALSTPFGRRGWFYEAWDGRDGTPWTRVRVTAHDVPRIKPEFLEEERLTLTDLWYRQEYLCDFVALEGAEWPYDYFPDSLWFDDWPERLYPFTIACDPSKGKDAKTGDYAAFALLGLDDEGTLWCEAVMLRGQPAEAVADQAIALQAAYHADLFGIESNQFLQLFSVLFDLKAKARNMLMPIVEIENRDPKVVRIRRLGPYLCQRKIRFRNTPGTRLLVQQLQEFPEGASDDGPDAAEMALRIMDEMLTGLLRQRG
jgi:predicted phage terminase large subunit-like protein